MPISRKFLDWSRPALVTAAEYLLARYTEGSLAELANVVVVMPGGRAGRRLLEILVRLCEERNLVLAPPKIATAGTLPEALYRPKQRFATDLEQQLAWVRAIQEQNQEELSKVVRAIPPADDALGWLDLAALLQQLHRELASDLLDFERVIEHGASVEGFASEIPRWRTLAAIQKSYLATLDELELWDVQTARRVAIEKRECRTDNDIVLVGTADLNVALRQMLDQVEEQSPGHVTALVFAPLDLTERFDSHGCVVPDLWEAATIEIPEKIILTANDAAGQADLTVRTIASYGGRYRADEMTIGVPDELLVPQVERLLAQCNLPVRWGPGRLLSRSGVYRLLEAFGEYFEARRPATFAALARHPDLAQRLHGQGIRDGWLTELDNYHNAHFPFEWGHEWLGQEIESKTLRPVQAAMEQLLAPISHKSLSLHEWGPLLVNLLSAVYESRKLNRDDEADVALLVAAKKIGEAFQALSEIGPELSPRVSASAALEVALRQVASETIPPPADEEAIELLGWLELPLDDAPALIVASLNEGFVPQATNADMFLPNALRTKLKLEDNSRRYARDAYVLSMLLASRRDLALIVARRDTAGSPTAPSRLLFATDDETIARRALRFFEPLSEATPRAPLSGAWVAGRPLADFPVPLPLPLKTPIDKLSVTAFRAYLACPYRFYLKYVEQLKALDDAADELDGGAFGVVMHTVLQRFALGVARDSADPAAIRQALFHELNDCVAANFGRRPAAAIAIQAEQMRGRLAVFAERQAERAAEGWHIESVEQGGLEWNWPVDDLPFLLRGQIDRIDVNLKTGQRAILDYKTSDAGLAPRKTHQKSDEWIDLQLPLYRYLAQSLKVSGPFELGYVLLPKDVSKTGFVKADWNDAELKAADEVAQGVIRNLRRGVFWPPANPPPAFSEELAPICQDGVYKARTA